MPHDEPPITGYLDRFSHRPGGGEPLNDPIGAEIVYFEREGGGAVCLAGSITFRRSLWRNGFEGLISRMPNNVVRRFSA